MSEAVGSNGAVDSGAGSTGEAAKTFTQDQVNSLIAEQKRQIQSKYADYDALKGKANQFEAIEEANRTEAEKALKRAEKAEQKAAALEADKLRFEVAADKGVPAVLLTATDKASLEAQADALLAFRGEANAPKTPQPDESQGRNSGGTPHALNGDGLEQALRAKLRI